MIVDKINAYLNAEGRLVSEAILQEVGKLSQYAFKRQFTEPKHDSGYRLSSIGRCLRQQAYKALGIDGDGKELDARARMVFLMGDLTEIAIVGLAKAAGCKITRTGEDQAEVEIDGIKGHPDGVLDDSVLFECKSMSSYSFTEFERGHIDDGYRYQCNAYMEALGLKSCVIVGLNKDAGVLSEFVFNKSPEIVQSIRDRIALLKSATTDKLPEREYQPDAKNYLPWQCRYCSHYKTCYPESELVLKGNSYRLYLRPKEALTS